MEVEKMPEDRTNPKATELLITLKIEAAKIYNLKSPTREDLNKYCYLSDSVSPEDPHLDELKYFTSDVVRGQQVKWEARNLKKEERAEYPVAIESIVYAYHKENELTRYRKENFFNAIAICSTKGDTVRAKVLEEIEAGRVIYLYNINFCISKSGEVTKRFSIDPRLKIDK